MILHNDIPYAAAATETAPGYLAIRGYLTTDPVADVDTSAYSAIKQWIEGQEPGAAITLDIDSPGGDITGLEALCAAIKAHEGPTVAYVSGVAASAGYWIASSCDQIVAVESAMIGSVGTMLPKALEPVPETDVVATLSPRKNAADDQWQVLIDASCERFLSHVATSRGWPQTDLEAIADRVGNGKMMTAQEAMARGLIDRIEGGSMDPDQTPEVIPEGEKTMEDAVREHEARLADVERRIDELQAIIDNLKREGADDKADIEEERLEEEAPAAKSDKTCGNDQKMAAMAKALSDIQRHQRDELVARLVAQGKINPADAQIAKVVYDHDRKAFDRRYGAPSAMATVTRVSSGAPDKQEINTQDAVAMAYASMAKQPGLKFREAYKAALKQGGK